MFGGMFNGPGSNNMSSRRVIAFMYALAGIIAGGWCVYTGQVVWSTIAAAFGIPALVCVVLLLFTTWGDLTSAVDAVKGNRNIMISNQPGLKPEEKVNENAATKCVETITTPLDIGLNSSCAEPSSKEDVL